MTKLDDSKKILLEFVGASPEDDLIFTSGEEESSQRVLCSVALSGYKGKIVSPIVEDPTIEDAITALKYSSTKVPLTEKGIIKNLAQHLEEGAIFTCSWADPLTGIIQPAWEILDICKESNIITYLRGSEIFAKLFFRFQDLRIDFLSIGNLPISLLFKKASTKISQMPPTIFPSDQELDDLVTSCKLLMESAEHLVGEVAFLRSTLEDKLEKSIDGIAFFGKNANRLANISCFAIPGIHGEILLHYIKKYSIDLSIGGGRLRKLEDPLLHMGVPHLLAKGAVSLSLSPSTTPEDIDKIYNAVVSSVNALRCNVPCGIGIG